MQALNPTIDMKKDKKTPNGDSRRNFIKGTATALAGFYFLPRHVLGGPGFVAPSDRLRKKR